MKRPIAPFGNGAVRIRPIEERDLERTLAWRNRDEARVWFKTSSLITMEQHRSWFQRYQELDDDFLFIVENDGVPVGQVSIYRIDWKTSHAEVGRFLVAPEASGQGYIGQACAELLRFCLDTLKLRNVFLEVYESNHRAVNMYRRNGFVEESRHDGLIRMTRALAPTGKE